MCDACSSRPRAPVLHVCGVAAYKSTLCAGTVRVWRTESQASRRLSERLLVGVDRPLSQLASSSTSQLSAARQLHDSTLAVTAQLQDTLDKVGRRRSRAGV